MGADLVIVVFAVVVVGGMGSILGSIVTSFIARPARRPDQGVLSARRQHGDLRHHVHRSAGEARRPVRPGALRRCQHPRIRVVVFTPGCGPMRPVAAGAAGAADRAVFLLSAVPGEDPLLRAVRLRVQSAARLVRPALVRPCRLLRHGGLCCGPCRQGWGLPFELSIILGMLAAAPARRRLRLSVDPPAGPAIRDDHAGAGAADLLPRAATALHPRRGRPDRRAARQGARPVRAR